MIFLFLYFVNLYKKICRLILPFLSNLYFQLQDYSKTPSGETDVQFRVTRLTLEPMLKSMAYINKQLLASANRVALINLKVRTLLAPELSCDFCFYFWFLSQFYILAPFLERKIR